MAFTVSKAKKMLSQNGEAGGVSPYPAGSLSLCLPYAAAG